MGCGSPCEVSWWPRSWASSRARSDPSFWGQGADELFFGYAHFRRLTLEEAQARQRLDLARLLDFEWPRAQRIAESLGHDLRSPFLDSALRNAVAACRSGSISRIRE